MHERDLGPVVGHWERTLFMNVGTTIIALLVCVPGTIGIISLESRFETVLSWAALAMGVAAGGAALWQAFRSLNVKWTVHRDGFRRELFGRVIVATWEEIDLLYAAPSNEGRMRLRDGRTFHVGGVGIGPLTLLLDEAASKVALPRLRAELHSTGHLELGPLSLTPEGLHIDGALFPLTDRAVRRSLRELVATHGLQTLWVFHCENPAREAKVFIDQVPFPSASLELLVEHAQSLGA
jgi:hypothetical protein